MEEKVLLKIPKEEIGKFLIYKNNPPKNLTLKDVLDLLQKIELADKTPPKIPERKKTLDFIPGFNKHLNTPPVESITSPKSDSTRPSTSFKDLIKEIELKKSKEDKRNQEEKKKEEEKKVEEKRIKDEKRAEEEKKIFEERDKRRDGTGLLIDPTKEELVSEIIYSKNRSYVKIFALTFSSLMTPIELLDFIEKLTNEVLKILAFLKILIQTHSFEPIGVLDQKFVDKLTQIFENNIKKELYNNLLDTIKVKIETGEKDSPRMFSTPAPKTILPKDFTKFETEKFNILDWDSCEIARQFCLIDYDIKKKWSHQDFYQILWKESTEKREEFTMRHDRISKWIICQILIEEDPAMRAKVITKILDVCHHLETLQNYDTLHAFITAMGSQHIQKLRNTWKKIQDKYMEFCQFVRKVTPQELQKNVLNPPAVLYSGMILFQLDQISRNFPDKQGKLNFEKCHEFYKIYQNFILYTQTPYNLTKYEYLSKNFQTHNMKVLSDEDEFKFAKDF